MLAVDASDERRGRIARNEGAYKATLEEIKSLEAALPKLRQELDALTAEVSVAETGANIAALNLKAAQNTQAAATLGGQNATAERNAQRARADAEAAARAKAQREAEAQKAAERQRRIQEADALAAKEAEDVTRLQGEAMAHRATLDAAQGDVTRAREAYGAALRRQRGHQARFGSGYARSFTAGKDDAAVSRAAEEAAQAEAAFRQAAQAAEAFFKTFDAALKRERGEADRAAQRAKAARETN